MAARQCPVVLRSVKFPVQDSPWMPQKSTRAADKWGDDLAALLRCGWRRIFPWRRGCWRLWLQLSFSLFFLLGLFGHIPLTFFKRVVCSRHSVISIPERLSLECVQARRAFRKHKRNYLPVDRSSIFEVVRIASVRLLPALFPINARSPSLPPTRWNLDLWCLRND